MPYTMREYMAEVTHRAERYGVASRIDGGTLETLLNQSRHDVQMATLQAVPERYARVHVPVGAATVSNVESARMFEMDPTLPGALAIINLVGALALPEDFIDIVTVIYEDPDTEEQWPMRQVDKRELYSTLTKSFTKPTPHNPLFVVEKLVSATAYRLLVSIGTSLPAAGSITIWYLAKLPYLQSAATGNVDDAETRLGYDLQELVVLLTLMRVLMILGLPQSVPLVQESVAMLVQGLQAQYEGAINRDGLLLQARELTIPNQFAPQGRVQ